MNLRTQLEGNSFSELIQRNTSDTNSLKADAFATADCKIQLGNLTWPATAGGANVDPDGHPTLLGAGSVNNDPTTECNENQLLLRAPDGTVSYRARNAIDPTGINGQLVFNGTNPGQIGPGLDGVLGTADDVTLTGIDRVIGGNDNDTIWGAAGADILNGNGGDDVVLGGDGNDIITDLDGADVPKGGPGNDAIDAGPGDDIVLGADGKDFLNGGANDNETFAGPGNDFIIAGQGADAVFGDSGDDWIEGGSGQDLLQGDHGAPFFDDPAQVAPGNDIFVGQTGENDYDAEGGDDVMVQDPAIDRNAGAGGFDWAIHQEFATCPSGASAAGCASPTPVGANDDMMINQMLVGLPIQLVVNRDRWQETEANSGGPASDTIRGDNLERIVGPGGFSGCDALDPTGVARIKNLDKLVTTFPTSLSDVFAASINGFCPLTGANTPAADLHTPSTLGGVWAEGNILLGGSESDLIEGRGNEDIIDGDHALTVGISVRSNPTNPDTEFAFTDEMEHPALTCCQLGEGSRQHRRVHLRIRHDSGHDAPAGRVRGQDRPRQSGGHALHRHAGRHGGPRPARRGSRR